MGSPWRDYWTDKRRTTTTKKLKGTTKRHKTASTGQNEHRCYIETKTDTKTHKTASTGHQMNRDAIMKLPTIKNSNKDSKSPGRDVKQLQRDSWQWKGAILLQRDTKQIQITDTLRHRQIMDTKTQNRYIEIQRDTKQPQRFNITTQMWNSYKDTTIQKRLTDSTKGSWSVCVSSF